MGQAVATKPSATKRPAAGGGGFGAKPFGARDAI
jgi:hypothetical protein